jgi:hypothetical protein
MRTGHLSTLCSTLTVPSPLAGEGQGEGYHTACSINVPIYRHPRLMEQCTHQRSRPGPPLSPALPRKGGGSAASTWREFVTSQHGETPA